jgi:hypothetical protein
VAMGDWEHGSHPARLTFLAGSSGVWKDGGLRTCSFPKRANTALWFFVCFFFLNEHVFKQLKWTQGSRGGWRVAPSENWDAG